jgi:hypothetical protein
VAHRLGVTHFVDDRLDVPAYLESVEHRYLSVGGRAEPVASPRRLPDWVTVGRTWPELVDVMVVSPRPPMTHPGQGGLRR